MSQNRKPPGKRQPKRLPRWARWSITTGTVVAGVLLIVLFLPRGGLSTDLSRLGQGEPVAVVTFESAHPGTVNAMERISEFREESPEALEFLVADLGTPEGEQFARRHGVSSPGLVIFFDGRGQRRETLRSPETTTDLREAAESVNGTGY